MNAQPDLWSFLPPQERLMDADEIFEVDDGDVLRRLLENRRIERKPTSFSGSPLGEYIWMWANFAPEGGIIAIGVFDEKTGEDAFEGCMKLSENQINNLEKAGRVFCPDADVKTKQVKVRNSKGEDDFVLLFRVRYNAHIVVKNTAGRVFTRIADTKVELRSVEELRELQADKGQLNFEQEPCYLNYPDDFDENAIGYFVTEVRRQRRISDSLNMADVLDVRHLGRFVQGQFQPNYACALLFGKDPLRIVPGCKIHFQRFDGEFEKTGQQYNVIKSEIVEGNVLQLIRQTEALLKAQLRTFSPLDKKGKFFPIPEYPYEAWIEAIVNACAHRSYSNGMKNIPIFVKMFDDHLVVESPGPFPPNVTSETIYNHHSPRNPKLMDALYYLDITRCAKEGAKRIRDSMQKMNLPAPEFTQVESGVRLVRVTLKNNIHQRRAWVDKDVGRIVGESIAATLTEYEKRVLNWMAEHGSLTISDADKVLDISWQRARRLLLGLARKRLCQYIRFEPFAKDIRDPRAMFRLPTNAAPPDGAFVVDMDNVEHIEKSLGGDGLARAELGDAETI